jgi:hypothetical protein
MLGRVQFEPSLGSLWHKCCKLMITQRELTRRVIGNKSSVPGGYPPRPPGLASLGPSYVCVRSCVHASPNRATGVRHDVCCPIPPGSRSNLLQLRMYALSLTRKHSYISPSVIGIHSFTRSVIHSLSHSLAQSFTRSVIHSLIHSLTHKHIHTHICIHSHSTASSC